MVSSEEIRRLAFLSRIDLSDAELDTYLSQIESIVDYFNQLDKVPLRAVERLASRRSHSDMRPDEVSSFSGDPFGTKHRKEGFVKGPRMT